MPDEGNACRNEGIDCDLLSLGGDLHHEGPRDRERVDLENDAGAHVVAVAEGDQGSSEEVEEVCTQVPEVHAQGMEEVEEDCDQVRRDHVLG